MIHEGEQLICKLCGETFRKPHNNSTINPKLCHRCQSLKDFESKKRRKENKKLLSQSNLMGYNKRSGFKPGKYTPNKKKVKNKLKTPKERFYKSTAWRWFSRCILLKNTIDKKGTTTRCCTCGKLMLVNSRNCHVGHYIKVFDGNNTNYSTAFLELNVGPQCDQCNHYRGGSMDEMAVYIKNKHGKDTMEKLMEIKRQPMKLDAALLEDISSKYKAKFKDILEEKGIQNPWKKR
jgi:hypothetical protein